MIARYPTGVTASSISLTAIALTSLWTQAAAINAKVAQGCFSSSNGLTLQGHWLYQSQDYCQQQCVSMNQPVMGLTQGGDCWCGNLTPPGGAKVSDSQCGTKCLGWPAQTCGGDGTFQVFLTGTQPSVGSAQDTSNNNNNNNNNGNNAPPPVVAPASVSSVIDSAPPVVSTIVSQGPPITKTLEPETVTASGQSTTIPPSVVTVGGGATQVITMEPTATLPVAGAQQSENPTGPSPTAASGTSTGTKVGIAVGAIAAVLVLATGLGFGVFYYLKKKRADYAGSGAAGSPTPGGLARNNTAHSFSTSGGFAGSGTTPGGYGRNGSVNDSRLDPGMVDTRRGSVGSIFDDSEDYSRKVLKVTN